MSSFGPPPGPDPNPTPPLPAFGSAPPQPPLGPAPQPRGKPPKAARAKADSASAYGNVGAYLAARLVAFLIDVPGLAFVVVAFAFGQLKLDTRFAIPAAQSSFPFVASASLLGVLAFSMLCEGVIGTTLGKALFMLHVHKARGGYAGLGRAIVRAIMRPVDLLAIGPILAAVTPRHQRLGDFAAGTTVARSPVGALAPIVAVVLLAGAGYVQFAFGGGLDSAIAVAAETSFFAPVWENDVTGALAVVIPGLRGPAPGAPAGGNEPAPFGSPAPLGSPTPSVASALPSAASAPVETFPPGNPAGAAASAAPPATPEAGASAAGSPATVPAGEATPSSENVPSTPAPAPASSGLPTTPV